MYQRKPIEVGRSESSWAHEKITLLLRSVNVGFLNLGIIPIERRREKNNFEDDLVRADLRIRRRGRSLQTP